jgi:hypothetical protein
MLVVRRIVWFTSGVTAGFGAAIWIRRRVLRTVRRYTPERLQADASASIRRWGRDVRDAIADGRRTKREREAELRRELRPGSPVQVPTPDGRARITL